MKTLDEVIEKCQGYVDDVARGWDKQDCSLPYDDMTDALHYLKEYQRDKDELNSTRLAYLDILTDYVALKNFWAESQANPPSLGMN